MQTVTSAIKIAHLALQVVLPGARTVVDATAGQGSDTLFLAQHTDSDAHIYAFDIQPAALQMTRARTCQFADRISYLLCSHTDIPAMVPQPIDAAIFNLGYLPGASHAVTTLPETTLQAVQQVVSQLRVNGVLAIVVYPGHAAGRQEAELLAPYIRSLPRRYFTSGCYKMLNHAEQAPFAYIIEKVRG